MKQVLYSDLDLKFLAHPVTGNVKILTGVDAIKQSIRILVMTNKYEKIYKTNVYTNVTYSLFELMTDTNLISLKSKIKDIIDLYEPRATLIDVKVRNNLDLNEISLSIYFQPQNAFETEVIEIFLERIR